MSKIKIFQIALFLGLMTFVSSCDRYFEGVNDNPNQPEVVPPNMLLPSAQAFIAYGNGGDISRFTSLLMQYASGETRQFAVYQTYQITETETDNWWRFNMYGGGLKDIYQMIKIAEDEGLSQYVGIGKVLMAYGIMGVTDMVGDAPYSEAFLEADDLTPKWDTQEEIYNSIFTLLTEAKADLADPTAPITPGSDDLIYGGDVDLWTRTANVLMARAYLHLGKVDGANYQRALDALGTEGVDSYGSNGDDAIFFFGAGPTEAGPWSQYIGQRDDIGYTGNFINTFMTGQGDPRLDVYFDAANNTLGAAYADPDVGYYFASYAEQKFIEAEAASQTGDGVRAANAHNAAVLASLARHGVSDAAFEAAHAQQTDATIDLQEIMEQKYVAMFLEPEAFTDWRRTGFPVLTAVPNNVTGGIIPRRLPYPQSERLYNSPNFVDRAITTSVWWDQ